MKPTSVASKKTSRNNVIMKVLSWFRDLWFFVINTGVDAEMPLWERKRTRLLNGICFMGTAAQTWYVVSYTAPEERYVFWEAFQSAVFYLIPILLNHYKQHNLACHLFCIYNIINYSYMAISHGKVDGTEYFLLPSGIAAMLFFRNTRIIFTYFLINFIFFWICKYSFSVLKPIVVLPFNTYVPNQILFFIVSFLVVFYFRTENSRQERLLENKNRTLAEEKIKSDNLLLNILPAETAEELKATGRARTMRFEEVTVMFTDFHQFTELSEKINPEELVEMINFYFSAFDDIISNYGIEKIKTIGDSYMCVAGMPTKTDTHATDMILAALEIMQFINYHKEERRRTNKDFFELRLGIHTGPVVAGIVGIRKFAYDIWGDTVNTASRMESSGEVGMINISSTTYERIKDHFVCHYRGKISVKSKGLVDMYYVEKNIEQGTRNNE